MSDDTDFVALYNELGLEAECSMALLKQAYRRRVRELHPDLPEPKGDIGQLQRLNQLYAAAIEFERLHGRLPGSSHDTVPRAKPTTAWSANEPSGPDGSEGPPVAGSRPWMRYIVLLGVLVIVLLWLPPQETSAPASQAQESAEAASDDDNTVAAEARVSMLAIGMESSQVLRLQGAPLNEDERHWDYGPSWIDFDCGQLSDWYSSPLRPLRVSTTRPDPADAKLLPTKKPPGC